MFETSRPNGAAIALYRPSAARPVANSLSTDLYGLIPNSTDVTVFDERPWTILNFAVIGNETRYHSAGDDLAALDRRSVQHMGEQALAMVEQAASGTAPRPRASGSTPISPGAPDRAADAVRARPARPAAALLPRRRLAAACARPCRCSPWPRRWRARRRSPSPGTSSSSFSAPAIIGAPTRSSRRRPFTPPRSPSASSLCCWSPAPPSGARLRAAFWLLFLALGAALCIVAPGAAIYFLLPPLLAALGMAARRWWPHKPSSAGAIAAALCSST